MKIPWKAVAPIAVTIVLALLPAPTGLPQHAWYFFAIFAGATLGLVLEPLPGIEAAIERRLALYPLQGSGYGL
jgi:L-tartrate/succinate antiporter